MCIVPHQTITPNIYVYKVHHSFSICVFADFRTFSMRDILYRYNVPLRIRSYILDLRQILKSVVNCVLVKHTHRVAFIVLVVHLWANK